MDPLIRNQQPADSPPLPCHTVSEIMDAGVVGPELVGGGPIVRQRKPSLAGTIKQRQTEFSNATEKSAQLQLQLVRLPLIPSMLRLWKVLRETQTQTLHGLFSCVASSGEKLGLSQYGSSGCMVHAPIDAGEPLSHASSWALARHPCLTPFSPFSDWLEH
jgi:hypothetical protein